MTSAAPHYLVYVAESQREAMESYRLNRRKLYCLPSPWVLNNYLLTKPGLTHLLIFCYFSLFLLTGLKACTAGSISPAFQCLKHKHVSKKVITQLGIWVEMKAKLSTLASIFTTWQKYPVQLKFRDYKKKKKSLRQSFKHLVYEDMMN